MNAIAANTNFGLREAPGATVAGGGSLRSIEPACWPRAEADRVKDLTYLPGETIYYDGDESEFYYEVLSGTIRCCRLTVDGRRHIYRFVGAGEMIGLSGEEIYGQSAEAITEATVRRYRLRTLDDAMAENRALRDRVIQALRGELAAVRKHLMLVGRMTATERVAAFLLALSGQQERGGGHVTIPMTRADLADYLGLTLETVSRKINALKRQGLIEFSRPDEVRIKDVTALAALAEAA